MRRSRAFSLVEMIISMLIITIVGGALVTSLFMFYSVAGQVDDYISARGEIEGAWLHLAPQFTNAGLGMPNNRSGLDSFAAAFTGPGTQQPIMAQMGDPTRKDRTWGGPITLGRRGARDGTTSNSPNALKVTRTLTDAQWGQVFVGEELFYAWSKPTGIRIAAEDASGSGLLPVKTLSGNYTSSLSREGLPDTYNPMTLHMLLPGDIQRLTDFSDNGRAIGISNQARGANLRSWIVFPALRVPMLIFGNAGSIGTATETLQVQLAPYSYNDHGTGVKAELRGTLNGLDEVHLVQAACLFVDHSQHALVQRLYGASPADFQDRVLARNIAAIALIFNPTARLFTMHIAARGNIVETVQDRQIEAPAKWSALVARNLAPALSSDDLRHRILVESMTWRIKN